MISGSALNTSSSSPRVSATSTRPAGSAAMVVAPSPARSASWAEPSASTAVTEVWPRSSTTAVLPWVTMESTREVSLSRCATPVAEDNMNTDPSALPSTNFPSARRAIAVKSVSCSPATPVRTAVPAASVDADVPAPGRHQDMAGTVGGECGPGCPQGDGAGRDPVRAQHRQRVRGARIGAAEHHQSPGRRVDDRRDAIPGEFANFSGRRRTWCGRGRRGGRADRSGAGVGVPRGASGQQGCRNQSAPDKASNCGFGDGWHGGLSVCRVKRRL